MADIAFLLLIFFLVTTTIDTDSGISRKLPPMPEEEQQEDKDKIKERNVLVVLVNRNDDLLVDGERVHISRLKEKAIEFITNPSNKESLPEKVLLSEKKKKALSKDKEEKAREIQEAIDLLGDIPTTKGVVSLQNDRATSYRAYIQVQDELTAAFREVRDRLAVEKFGKKYKELDEEKADAITEVYPLAISEAEPVEI